MSAKRTWDVRIADTNAWRAAAAARHARCRDCPTELGAAADGSVDPVAARLDAVAGVDDRVEDAAAALDHRRRADVVVVARHEDPVDAERPGHDKALPQDLRRVAASAVLDEHA